MKTIMFSGLVMGVIGAGTGHFEVMAVGLGVYLFFALTNNKKK